MSLTEKMGVKQTLPKDDTAPTSYKAQMENGNLGSRHGLRVAETFVKKFYLDELNRYKVTKVPRSVSESTNEQKIKMFKLTGLVIDKDENVIDRLNNIYGSMHGLDLSVIFLIISDGKSVDLYLGIKTNTSDFQDNIELSDAFQKVFKGNFPGSKIEMVPIPQCNNILNEIMPESGKNAITSLTSLPSLKNDEAENIQYVQGIEKFIDTMQGEKYAVLIISDPVSGGQIERIKQGYEELYSELAPLAEYNLTLGTNEGVSLTESQMEGYTDTIGKSVSKTQSFTKGTSVTKSESTTNTFGIGAGVMGNLGSMDSITSNSSKNIVQTLISSLFGGPVAEVAASSLSQAIGANLGINISKAKQTGTAIADQDSQQIGHQETEQKTQAKTTQESLQQGITTGSSTTTMVKYENKPIKAFLQCVDDHLERLKECENYGMWSSAAYFISHSKETSIISASAYKGIINGEGTSLEASSLNTWFGDENTKTINDYLKHFTHPRFYHPDLLIDYSTPADVTASTMVSTKELSIQCGIPYKSVPGVFVREMVGFGRDVYNADELINQEKNKKIKLGCIHHMGEDYSNYEVSFELNRLKEHTFITGSTGSGKSNTVYKLISELNGTSGHIKIPTLIIEPAKGEYKQIFGNKFNVYGTNPKKTQLLQINPFKFEEDIHIHEHIDRLIDIFNVCWPMYAAMPAVLKEAIENAYVQCGWNLNTSVNQYSCDIFPNFYDLLEALRNVISKSDYSQEVKDNYTGSLITRVKSLTNGLNGQIFTANEIDNSKLFEENCIVDLSRVGSSETKSMIMGILIMRLQEYRMSQGGINLDLKHVTIIEEAHNLLKRTSTEQSVEGSNLLGKSVEMIANAIAEMRTYGEGFVIVDQAPALLDLSVIRNTNTKIIMHLPDMTDRELVGLAAGLSDNQLVELAKIPTGIAVVYQNRWIEPVLCHVDYYDVKPVEYLFKEMKTITDFDSQAKQCIIEYLVSLKEKTSDFKDIEKLKIYLTQSSLSSAVKIDIFSLLTSTRKISTFAIEKLVCDIVDSQNEAMKKSKDAKNIDEWNNALINNLEMVTEDLTQEVKNAILECLIHQRSLENESDEQYFIKWMNYMGRGLM